MAKKEQHLPAAGKAKETKPKLSPLQKAQHRFNTLVTKIAEAEEENKRQSTLTDRYHQLYQQKVLPLLRQYAAEKTALVQQFDAILARHKFGKAQQRRFAQWAVETLMEVAPYSEEATALLQVHHQRLYELLPNRKKQQAAENKEDGQEAAAFEQEKATDPFDAEDFFDFEHGFRPPEKKTQKAAPEADGIGPLYKELAKKLHPDLEQDEEEKARKHELMQQLTEARKHRDLYTLLRIKANLEKEAAAPNSWGLEQLKRYNRLLEEKLQQLKMQLSAALMGSLLQHGLAALDAGDPEKEINREVRNLKKTIRNIREDRPHINSRQHLEDLLESLRWDGYR